MPRRSGGFGGRRSAPTRTRTRAAPQRKAAPPAPMKKSAPTNSSSATPGAAGGGGGGMLSGLGATLMQGMAFGTGSAVAHRAIDAVAGPRTVQHEWADEKGQTAADSNSAAAMPGAGGGGGMGQQQQNPCMDPTQAFSQCVTENSGNVGACSFFYDRLSQCQAMNKDWFAAQQMQQR